MSKMTRQIVSVCMAMIFVMGFVFSSSSVQAAGNIPEFPQQWDLYCTGNPIQDTNYLTFDHLPKNAKVLKVVSSKPAVLKAGVYTFSDGEQTIEGMAKKPGTSVLRIRVKVGKKIYNLKSKVTVYKHENVFSSFKIAGIQIANRFKKAEYINMTNPQKKGAVNIKPKKGWNIKEIKYKTDIEEQVLKNRKSLNFKNLDDDINLEVVMQHHKTKQLRYFYVYMQS